MYVKCTLNKKKIKFLQDRNEDKKINKKNLVD